MIPLGLHCGDFICIGYIYHTIELVCIFGLGIFVVGKRSATKNEPVLAPYIGVHVLSHEQPAFPHYRRLFQGLASVLILGDLELE